MCSDCCFSVAKSCTTLCDPWTAACQAFLSFPISQGLLKFMSIESVMLSNHLILCLPLLLRIFSSESALCIRWPKYQSFSFSISPSKEYIQGWFPSRLTGLISLLSKGLSRVFSSTTTWATKTKYHRLHAFKKGNRFSHSPGSWKV